MGTLRVGSTRIPRYLSTVAVLAGLILSASTVRSQEGAGEPSDPPSLDTLSLASMEAFRPVESNWGIAGEVTAVPGGRERFEVEPGTGILVNRPDPDHRSNLRTRLAHRDLVLEFDVMMPPGSNSGIYLQGRYEIQLLDSWGKKRPTYGDMAGIYQRWDPERPPGERGYQGHPPRVNVSRAPGLWQHVRVVFRAARFDSAGRKIENARILQVIHNGVTVHQNVELTGPTRGGDSEGPGPAPITIQGDHGPVAFRHIRYRTYDDRPVQEAIGPSRGDPIEVQVGAAPVVMRGFVSHPGAGNVSFTGLPVVVEGVSVGSPGGPHYSVDLESGSLLRVWKGPFLNAEQMWRHRGPDQTARAMGSVITLSRAPPVAVLEDPDAAWPDSAGERLASTGYALGGQGYPTFRYRLGDLRIEDRLQPVREGRGLSRALTVEGSAEGTSGASLWCRLATARTIERVDEALYAVGGRTYYVETSSSEGPRIRDVPSGQELIVPVPGDDGSRTVRYTLLW